MRCTIFVSALKFDAVCRFRRDQPKWPASCAKEVLSAIFIISFNHDFGQIFSGRHRGGSERNFSLPSRAPLIYNTYPFFDDFCLFKVLLRHSKRIPQEWFVHEVFCLPSETLQRRISTVALHSLSSPFFRTLVIITLALARRHHKLFHIRVSTECMFMIS